MRFLLGLIAATVISASAHASESDPFALIVNQSNMLDEMDTGTARGIFGGTVTDWSAVPDSGLSGSILAMVLDRANPAYAPIMNAFLQRIMLTQLGADVNVVRGPMAKMIIAVTVANNTRAIGVDDPTALVAGDSTLEIEGD